MFWATAAWACGVLAVPDEAGSARSVARAATVARCVHDDLVRGHVRPGVVQDVPVPLRGQDADQGGDEDAEADGRQGRARPGPVAGQVAQGQAYRDRGTPPETARITRQKGASRMIATMSRTMPRMSSSAPPPLPLLVPEYDSRAAAMTNRTTPGTAERCTCFGGRAARTGRRQWGSW
jgi:hypothetical protein